jgi:hypothetical protein
MEFKGTKVFPKYEGGDNNSIDLIFDNEATITICRASRYSDKLVMSREEMEANALLITKSYMLLQTVEDLLKELNYHGFNSSTAINKARQLIKEAKEINYE